MNEVNILFLPVRQFCRQQVVTTVPDDLLVNAAATMRQHTISSIVVCEQGAPVGIVTDRDMRNKIIARGLDPNRLTVRDIMNSPLITVDEDVFVFEALYQMSKNGIHRVGVIDRQGRLVGIITDSDILRLQSRSPQLLIRKIEEATTLQELQELHLQVQKLVVHLVGTGVQTSELVRVIAHLNDHLLLRLIVLLRDSRFPDLPARFAFIVLGSEGRQEQTLTTDQDNAIVYADDLSTDEIARIEAFSRELIKQLIAMGVPECPGGIMASNGEWRRSLEGWNEVLESWLGQPTPEHILTGSMFFDLRTIYGDPTLERALKSHIASWLQIEPFFLRYAAANVLRFEPPLSWTGRVKVERKGEHRGLVDIKKAGIFAITEGVKVLALEAGIVDGGTRERLTALVTAGTLTPVQAEDLESSFNFMVHLRLRGQVAAIQEGREPTNFIDLRQLNRMEQGRLQMALEGVRTFQSFLKLRFDLDMLR
jgi:CBS domain-containing protein